MLTQFVAATDGDTTATPQEQADHVLAMLKKYLVDKAKDRARVTKRNERDSAIEAEIGALDW